MQAASAAGVLIRINGGKAAVSCICKQQLLAVTVQIYAARAGKCPSAFAVHASVLQVAS